MYTKALSALLLVLGLVSLASAVPHVQRRSFLAPRVANDGFTGKNGPRALAKAYRKFRMPLPAGLVNTLEQQDRVLEKRRNKWTGGVALENVAELVNTKDQVVESDDVSNKSLLGDLLGGLLGGGGGNQQGNPATGNPAAGQPAAGQPAAGQPAAGQPAAGQPAGQPALLDNLLLDNLLLATPPATRAARDLADAIAKTREGNQTGETQAIPEQNDVEYLSQVKIGGQPVTLDFDTGSSDLWVFNSLLPASDQQGRTIYDPRQSQSFELMQGSEFQIKYGDGSGADGRVGSDVVEIGGAAVPRQAIELATNVSGQFLQDTNNDGLLGLAFGSINTVQPQKQKTFFENIMPSLAEPVFTADLRANAPGAYEFGRIDQSKFTGEMAWIPVDTRNGFWQFSSEKFAVGDGQAQPGGQGAQAIADTGTTLLLADPAIVEGYYSQIPQAQQAKDGIVIPCNAKLPDLHLDIGGVYMAKVKGEDLNFAPVDNAGTTCFGGLQATSVNGLGIYGDILFKSQFVAFNGGNNSLGMAPHV
ncbi:penicillopepsin [Cordyceps fumosorosea ARSEF 2679]|uniref:Penicillopepsin n=1 Tax=Cordyceps fumosorosea (strain ARSEF 2679) TaxID=1081104 RepID=A0A168B7K2_CORFA|nr:penicillopepsin [Cordyceps fumosorosea ARSEF 2679]OAA69733.1 penicillopepsin [Cordyceps fumosorosea ARSEF 2679]